MGDVVIFILFFALFFMGLGALIGRFVFKSPSRDIPPRPPLWREDLAATWRTLHRLRKEGLLEESDREQVIAALRALYRDANAPPSSPAASINVEQSEAIRDSISDEAPVQAMPPVAKAAPPDVPDVVEPEIILAEEIERPDTPAPPPVAPIDTGRLPAAVPMTPRRAFSDMMQAFMEDKNIRWGELISGVLIVGCSIALVISLQHEIQQLSKQFIYLPALMFLLVTAAIHGAGNYTLRRWNLTATSRGVLIIATLLIPINFLATITVTGPESRELSLFHPLVISAMLVGLVAFGTMTYYAGRVLLAEGWWRLWIGVMGTSVGQLIINRSLHGDASPLQIHLLAATPLAAFLVATIWQLHIATRRKHLGGRRGTDTLLLLGIVTFSLAATLGLLVSRSDSISTALAWLSTPLSLTAVVILATGLAIHNRVTLQRLTALKTTGTALALVGGFFMLLAFALAWPEPQLLVAVGLFSFLALTIVAIVGRLEILHVPAIASGTFAYLVVFHLLQGHFSEYGSNQSQQLIDIAMMGRSSVALTVLSLGVGICGVVLMRLKLRPAGVSYLMSAAGIGCISILVAVIAGFLGIGQDPELATPVLAFYAVAILLASYLKPHKVLTWIGTTLLWVTLLHGLAWNDVVHQWLAAASLVPERPALFATLFHGLVTVALAGGMALRGRSKNAERDDGANDLRWNEFVLPLSSSSLLSAIAASPFALFVLQQHIGAHAAYVVAIAFIWLVASVIRYSSREFIVFHALATIGVIYTVAAVCQQQSWWTGELILPQHFQAQFAAMAVWCLAWSIGRRFSSRWPKVRTLLRTEEVTVDEIVLGATLLGMLTVLVVGCWPGICIELGIANAQEFSRLADHQTVFSLGSWIVSGLILVAVLASLVESFSIAAFLGILLTPAFVCMLVAGDFYDTDAVASALRWLLAVYGALATGAICFRSRIAAGIRQLEWLQWKPLPDKLGELARSWTLGICALPILALTTTSLIQAASGNPPGGPSDVSFFTRIDAELSFGIPLIALVGILVVHAVREKNSSFMIAGSLVFQYVVNLAFFLPILRQPNAAADWPNVIGCIQFNTLGLGIYGLFWLAIERWTEPRDHESQVEPSIDSWLTKQVLASITSFAVLTGLAMALVVVRPRALASVSDLGNPLSYACLLVTAISVVWFLKKRIDQFGVHLLLGGLFALSGPLAISLDTIVKSGQWVGMHAMMIQWSIVAIAATSLAWVNPRWLKQNQTSSAAVVWASNMIMLLVSLALWTASSDPQTPWWSFGTTLVAAVLAGAIGARQRSQRYAYGSIFLTMVAVTIAWWGAWPNNNAQGIVELMQLNLIAAVVSALVWLFVELRSQRKEGQSFDSHFRGPAAHRSVAVIATASLLLITGLGFALTGILGVPRTEVDIANLTGEILLGLLGGLLILSLWDKRTKLSLPNLYAWGIIVTIVSLDEVDQLFAFDGQTMFVVTGLVIAVYVAATGFLWKQGPSLAAIVYRWGISDPVSHLKRTSQWLPVVSVVFAAFIVVIELGVVLTFQERWMRVSAAVAPLLLAYGISCHAQKDRRVKMQTLSLILASLAAVYASWADLEISWQATFALERSVRLLMALSGLTLLYGIFVPKWLVGPDSDWRPSIRRLATACALSAVASLVAVLMLELIFFQPGIGTPFGHPYQIVAVAVMIVGLIAGLLAMALMPEHDPLSMSERGRMIYVYLAQVVGTLLFAHIYLSNPQIFGTLKPYWPYIVMGIAFAGVGVGEIFQRSKLPVLAEPLQRTGGFLPLLPALGWWLSGTMDIEVAGHYSLLLFSAGLIYVMLSMLRRSLASALLAVLAGNAAFWSLLADYEPLSLFQHPQIWLIPPALSVLIAAQINRRRFTEAQMTAVRYIALMVVYVSSTGDIFIEGVGNSLWEPMVLTLISVIGVFIGIGFRIRAFLFLGTTFVFLSVVTMVWHAYSNIQHVGIWWAFGLVLGLLILTIFGIFEKKRPEITQMIDSMKKWEQ